MDAACQAAFAAALLDPAAPLPAGLAAPRGGDPGRRFAVYRNTVTVSLLEALEARFPVTRALVGEAFFRAAARAFLKARPPRSPLLFRFGDELPAFLASFPPAQGLPYLADVAALEAARTRAFHAADADPLAAADLAALAPETLAGLRLALHPSVELIASAFPVVGLWAAHQQAEPAAIEAALAALDLARGEDALVWRSGEDVLVRVLPAGAILFLRALQAGRPLAEAAADALAAQPAFDLPAALALLLGQGLAVRPDSQGDLP